MQADVSRAIERSAAMPDHSVQGMPAPLRLPNPLGLPTTDASRMSWRADLQARTIGRLARCCGPRRDPVRSCRFCPSYPSCRSSRIRGSPSDAGRARRTTIVGLETPRRGRQRLSQ